MTNPSLRIAVASALACLFVGSNTASAVLVAPGSTVALPGTTTVADPFLSGTVIQDESFDFSLPISQSSTSLITGTVQQRVVAEDMTGYLDFYWRITRLSGGSLGYFRVGDFVNDTYDANFRIDGLGDVGPTSITRFTAGMGGSTDDYGANFNFVDDAYQDTLAAGQESKFMFLHTTATQYAKTAFFDVASTGTYTASAQFAAYAPVPEPETYAMMIVGLGLLGAVARRRRTKAA
jgi:PEP-CTERM motif